MREYDVRGGLEGPANNACAEMFCCFFRFVSFSVFVSSSAAVVVVVQLHSVVSTPTSWVGRSRRSRPPECAAACAALRRDDDFLLPSSVSDRVTLRWRINVASKRIVITGLARLTHVVPQHIGLLFIKLWSVCVCLFVCLCVCALTNTMLIARRAFVILVALQVHEIH